MHCTDAKKPTGNANSTAGCTDKADFATTVQAVKPLALHTTDAPLAPWLMANAANVANPANACCTVAGAGYVATLATVATKKRTCTTAPRRGTVRSGASNTQQTAEILPDSEVFSRPKITVANLAARSYGLDGRSGNARRTTVCVLLTSSPPFARSKAKSGFQQFKQELETMTTSPVASRCAAPTSKATQAAIPSTEAQAFALLQAVTSTNLAGFYLRRDNIAQARRKLRQALQALSALEVQHA